MRFRRQDGWDRVEPLQIPAMVDVVFILLSFFIMATRFRLPERYFAMGYRRMSLSSGARAEDFPSLIPVRLARSASGVAITVGRAHLADNDYEGIRERLAEINLPSIPVVVMAEAALSVDQVAQALDAVLSSPMKQVSVSRLASRASEGEVGAPRGPPEG